MARFAVRVANVALAAAMAAVALPDAMRAQSAGPKPLDMTVIEATPGMQDLPFLAMKLVADKAKLKVEAIEFQGGGEAGAVFVGGRGDVLLAGYDKVIGITRQGLDDVKVIGNVLASGGWSLVLPADSPIKSIAELRGKTIGVSGPGSSSELFLRAGLRKAGLNPDKDVSVIALGSMDNIKAAIEHHKVDASMLASPHLMYGVADKTIKVLGDWEKIQYPGDVFVARAKDLAARRDDFVRFMSVYKDAVTQMKDPQFALKVARLRYPRTFTDQQLTDQINRHVEILWQPMDGLFTREQYDNGTAVLAESGRFKSSDMPAYEKLSVDLLAGR